MKPVRLLQKEKEGEGEGMEEGERGGGEGGGEEEEEVNVVARMTLGIYEKGQDTAVNILRPLPLGTKSKRVSWSPLVIYQ